MCLPLNKTRRHTELPTTFNPSRHMTSEVETIQRLTTRADPGYISQELIGGRRLRRSLESHAPGGLLKAVKLVYGDVSFQAASRELRCSNRIKEVRHAFLLSIGESRLRWQPGCCHGAGGPKSQAAL